MINKPWVPTSAVWKAYWTLPPKVPRRTRYSVPLSSLAAGKGLHPAQTLLGVRTLMLSQGHCASATWPEARDHLVGSPVPVHPGPAWTTTRSPTAQRGWRPRSFLPRSPTGGLRKGQHSPWPQSADRSRSGEGKPRAGEKALRGSNLQLPQCRSLTVPHVS